MRGTVTIKSITAKIIKLQATEAHLLKRIEDVRAQLEEAKIKKNELIAQMITSQVKDVDENVLQKILSDYAKEFGNNEDVSDKKDEESKAPSPAKVSAQEQTEEGKVEKKPKDVPAPADTKDDNESDDSSDDAAGKNDSNKGEEESSGEYQVKPSW